MVYLIVGQKVKNKKITKYGVFAYVIICIIYLKQSMEFLTKKSITICYFHRKF